MKHLVIKLILSSFRKITVEHEAAAIYIIYGSKDVFCMFYYNDSMIAIRSYPNEIGINNEILHNNDM